MKFGLRSPAYRKVDVAYAIREFKTEKIGRVMISGPQVVMTERFGDYDTYVGGRLREGLRLYAHEQ